MYIKKRMGELILCAIEQGFGLDLKPLYYDLQLDLTTYIMLVEILENEISI